MIHIRHSATPTMRRQHRQRMRQSFTAALIFLLLLCLAAFATPLLESPAEFSHHFQAVHFTPESTPQPTPPTQKNSRPIPLPHAEAPHAPGLPAIPRSGIAGFELPSLPDIDATEPDGIGLETSAEALAATQQEAPRPRSAEAPQAPHPTAKQSNSIATYTPPDYMKCPQPPYPPRLRRSQVQGEVGVLISIAPDGSPTDVEIAQSSGNSLLDHHTRRWILQHWHFSPALQDGKPLAAQVRTRVAYTLNS